MFRKYLSERIRLNCLSQSKRFGRSKYTLTKSDELLYRAYHVETLLNFNAEDNILETSKK